MSRNIVIFYHVYRTEKYESLVYEQLRRLQSSGLYAAASVICINVTGKGPKLDWVNMEFPRCIISYDLDDNSYELNTITRLQNYCKANPNDLILYFHTKGITHLNNPNVKDWRLLMEYFCIDNWKTCVKLLSTYRRTTVGVNLHIEPTPHYSGNFWWAQAKYINTLDPISRTSRMNAEFFLLDGRVPDTACSLFESGINHYIRRFPEELYIKISVKNHLIETFNLLKSFKPYLSNRWLRLYCLLN